MNQEHNFLEKYEKTLKDIQVIKEKIAELKQSRGIEVEDGNKQ